MDRTVEASVTILGMNPLAFGVLVVFGLLAVTSLFLMFFTIEQKNAAIVERFGKFVRVAWPGLNVKIPFIESVADILDLRIQQLEVEVETKTKDNVFVKIVVSVQYFIAESADKVVAAFYQLSDPEGQITSYVFDVVRAQVPKLNLDEVFEAKDDIADAVKAELAEVMDDFGYTIVKALVTDIDPDEKVKAAMNEINAAQRERVAANERGEAEKTLRVKAAEAEAKAKELQGEGMAKQRMAIADGIKKSIETLRASGVDPQEATVMMLMTQYFDTLSAMGAKSNSNLILMPHSPGAMGDLMQQITQAIATGNAAVPQPRPNGAGHPNAQA